MASCQKWSLRKFYLDVWLVIKIQNREIYRFTFIIWFLLWSTNNLSVEQQVWVSSVMQFIFMNIIQQGVHFSTGNKKNCCCLLLIYNTETNKAINHDIFVLCYIPLQRRYPLLSELLHRKQNLWLYASFSSDIFIFWCTKRWFISSGL